MKETTVPAGGAAWAWTVVIPFKGGPGAKSRLGTGTPGTAGFRPDVRQALALAFLADTVAAAQAVPAVGRIVIASSDQAVLTVPDIVLVADPGRGLNAAVTAGVEWAREQQDGGPVAVLAGDLPSLTSGDLAAALDLAAGHRLALVPDRHGTGTTLITAAPGTELVPRFGPGSCEAHRRDGHFLLPVSAASTLRADVDTPADLDRALRRGTGPRTRAIVLRSGPTAAGGTIRNGSRAWRPARPSAASA
ncbi:2-phospho-L-lactate guanylyltransferase [Arthrobacter sp. I2-34]|uniref:Phosphoenolpyruvate guanylyltransferase n=1 Tax=Arthrobacter hankyongi TaxID=2904801 RepID=A0ABS9L9V6_9MICC|nr:2-phospho-L-lactate guanylyltransferase [Arthrobacter hankyongi]MCG2623420.1 2-phospho-L-lactate guanylyltransferase [Arthrobacter hankyongi]